MKTTKWLILAGFLGGCATAPPPSEQTESTAASIRAAEEVGATHSPKASLHLQLAKEQSERAKQLMAKEQNEEATRLMTRAEADAELAVALARNEKEQADAKQMVEKVRTMQKSIQ